MSSNKEKQKKEKQKNVLGALLGVILAVLTEELMKQLVDQLLDFLENFVLGTKSKIDDKLLLPVIQRVRHTFDIPDDDEEKEN